MKNAKIIEWLKELIKFRNQEYIEKCEFNSFSEEDSNLYLANTAIIENIVEQMEDENNSSVKKEEKCIDSSEDIRQKLEDLEKKYSYLAADFKNYKNRVERDTDSTKNRIKKDILLKILPIVDDLERVMEEISHRQLLDDCSSLDVGIELTYENMLKSLESIGAKQIECCEGMPFDVSLHEAIGVQNLETKDELDLHPSGSIYQIFQEGWKLGDEVIRPTKVKVVG